MAEPPLSTGAVQDRLMLSLPEGVALRPVGLSGTGAPRTAMYSALLSVSADQLLSLSMSKASKMLQSLALRTFSLLEVVTSRPRSVVASIGMSRSRLAGVVPAVITTA